MSKVYRSKVDWWLRIAMVLPLVGSTAALVTGVIGGQAIMLVIGVVSLLFYAALLWGLVLPMSYAIAADGLRVHAGRQTLHIPYERLISAELSRNPLSSPALSMRRINVEYAKPNGKETYVLISPPDREAFLAELAAASRRHLLRDGKLVAKV